MTIVACSIDSCERKSVSRGWCDRHYRRWKRHGDPLYVKPGNGQWGDERPGAPESEQCAVDGCTVAKKCRGWCQMHYKRWLRNGDPVATQVRDDSRPCVVGGCEKTIRISDYCYAHYARMRRHGDVAAGRKPVDKAIDHPDGTRTCNTCSERKRLDEYHRGDLYTLGRSPKCRACCAQDRREWAAANQDLVDERSRAYRHKRRAMVAQAGFEHGLTRAKIRSWHGDECAYCGVEMDFDVRGLVSAPRKATIDHIVPIHRGGGHVTGNVTLCCARCNSSKGSKPLDEWRPGFIAPRLTPRYEQAELFELAS